MVTEDDLSHLEVQHLWSIPEGRLRIFLTNTDNEPESLNDAMVSRDQPRKKISRLPLAPYTAEKLIWNKRDKFALLWGEAQLCLPYLMFAYRKELPIVTLRWPTVILRWPNVTLMWTTATLRWPIVTLRWPIVTLRWLIMTLHTSTGH